MRLALCGQSYASRSLAAAAQTCVNLYAERIEDPQETAKGPGALYGAPGKHRFRKLTDIDPAATPLRGLWEGEGRVKVVAGSKYFEVDDAGALVGSVYTVNDNANHPPATILSNGHQILIVSAGICYCDNGSGPVEIGAHVTSGIVSTANYAGNLTTNGTTLLVWTGGTVNFTGLKGGDTITLMENGVANPYVIDYVDAGGASLETTVATQTSSAMIAYSAYIVRWVSGDSFASVAVGDQILIMPTLSIASTVGAVSDSQNLTVTTAINGAALGTAIPFSAYALNGTVTVDPTGHFVTWQSGDTFQLYGMVGTQLLIDGYSGPETVVESIQSPTQLTIAGTFGVGAPVLYSAQPYVSGNTAAFLDTYFIVSPAYSRQINISAINDGTTWDPLDVALKESYPDNIQSLLACNEQLYLFGEETFEVWQNVGSQLVNGIATFPFQRMSGAAQKFGSVSPWGPLALAGNVYFIGGTGGEPIAYVLNGFTPVRVSTSAIESAWRLAGLGQNCVSYGYTEDGHNFWVINFGSQTWCFDATVGAWSERRAWTGSAWAPYTTQYHVFVAGWGNGGMHITGGGPSGGDGDYLFESSVDFYDDNGADIKWERTLPYMYQTPPTTLVVASPGVSGGNRLYHGRMTLELEIGTGAIPAITRSYSDDRGSTFVNPQQPLIAAAGDNSRRVFWPLGGSSPNRLWRVSGVGQTKVALVALDCEITMGVN